MDDRSDVIVTERQNDKRPGLLMGLIIGLILGLLLSLLVYGIHKVMEENDKTNAINAALLYTGTGHTLINAGSDQTFYASSINYSSMLVETARESVDAPSVEGTAAQEALQSATDKLVKALGNDDSLSTDMKAFNAAFLTYSTAGTKNTDDVNAALTKVTNDLKSRYMVSNDSDFTTVSNDFKNSVLASIDKFSIEDYAGSYASEEAASNSLLQVFSHLQNK